MNRNVLLNWWESLKYESLIKIVLTSSLDYKYPRVWISHMWFIYQKKKEMYEGIRIHELEKKSY